MKPPKVSELLEKVNRTAANINFTKPGKLELDLLQEQLRDLYDELNALRNAGEGNILVEAKAESTEKITKKEKKLIINPNQNVLISEEVNDPITENELQVKKPAAEKLVGENTNQSERVIKPEVKKKEPVLKSSINESAKSVSSLNEKHKLAAKEVHKKLSTKPLKDLIDLNKKFVLTNELFKGNAEAYSAAIRHIENLNGYVEAEAFINAELKSNYFWDEQSQTVRLFFKLVKQKFGEE